MTARAYPLPHPESGNDPRFTFGLIHDVAKVLETHGFPPVRNGSDHVDLMTALFGFVFASEARPVPPVEDDSPVTYTEYRLALSYWERKAAEAQAAGDQSALTYRTRGAETMRRYVMRAEVTAQRAEWHLDLSDEALAELATHAVAGVAR